MEFNKNCNDKFTTINTEADFVNDKIIDFSSKFRVLMNKYQDLYKRNRELNFYKIRNALRWRLNSEIECFPLHRKLFQVNFCIYKFLVYVLPR